MFNFFKINKSNISESQSETIEGTSPEIPKPHYVSDIMEDEKGKFYIIKYWGKQERKTHVKGILKGKYRGQFEGENTISKFYNIEIYDSELFNVEKLEEVPPYDEIKKFPEKNLPEKISTCIKKGSDYYHISIHHSQFTERRNISQKLQQTDGKESFGVIEGEIFGFIADEENIEIEEKIYIKEPEICIPTKIPTGKTEFLHSRFRKEYWCECKTKTYWGNWEELALIKTNIRTGEKEYKGKYYREQYWYKDKKGKYWGNWKYRNNNYQENVGCGTVLGIIFWTILIIIFFPYLIYFLPFIILGLIIRFFRPLMQFLLPIISILFFIIFISSILRTFQSPKTAVNIPKVKDEPTEIRTIEKVKDSQNPTYNDSLITHFRKWKDYSKNEYEGKYSIKARDLKYSHQYKNNLPESDYGYFIHSLKENDKNYITGIYQLFDNLRKQKKLNNLQFAEMIVSFVQDIPYSLVLDKNCDPTLYKEQFIKEYFKSPNANCDPNQRNGINSPVEFLANLKGDCDTRTLLLYTLLDHYNYDVLLLSSNFYSHSIIAINLPIDGQKFNYFGKKYIVWETTDFIPPGIIPIETANQNKWKITLKSNNYGNQ